MKKTKVEKPIIDESKFVSKDDFQNFQSKIVDVLQTLSDKVEAQKAPERNVMMAGKPEEQKKVFAQRPSNEPVVHNLDSISPEYQAIFEKYFDMNDGFKADLRGVVFRIDVPYDLSTDPQKEQKKILIHCKVLDGNDIEGSMERYCKMVCQNLHYNRRVMLRL